MTTLTCADLVKYLSDYIDGELDEALSQAAEEHLATCPNCRVVLDSTQKTILLYQTQEQVITLPKQRKAQLYHQLADVFAHKDTDSS